MELATDADMYVPNIDEIGNYVDKIPSFIHIKNGLRCPCGSRKDKTYDTYSTFSSHIRTKCHKKWLDNLNVNRANYYIENENLKETIQNQRLIIAKMEKDLMTKIMTIDYLSKQLIGNINNTNTVSNLLDFD